MWAEDQNIPRYRNFWRVSYKKMGENQIQKAISATPDHNYLKLERIDKFFQIFIVTLKSKLNLHIF